MIIAAISKRICVIIGFITDKTVTFGVGSRL